MTDIAIDPTAPYALVATSREELQNAHAKMVAWTRARIDRVDVDLDVEAQSLAIAEERSFIVSPFKRRINVLKAQRVFYEKILAALEAGYAIVPNFQMRVFAVRTRREEPTGRAREGQYNSFREPAQLLPAGDGAYKDPVPTVHTERDHAKDAAGNTVTKYMQWPEGELDDVAFPMALARPELLTATGVALAEKVFDEIGVAVDTWDRNRGGGRGDPVLLGRILNPRPSRAAISFFIGWHFDPSRL